MNSKSIALLHREPPWFRLGPALVPPRKNAWPCRLGNHLGSSCFRLDLGMVPPRRNAWPCRIGSHLGSTWFHLGPGLVPPHKNAWPYSSANHLGSAAIQPGFHHTKMHGPAASETTLAPPGSGLGSTTQKRMALPHREPPWFRLDSALVPPHKNPWPCCIGNHLCSAWIHFSFHHAKVHGPTASGTTLFPPGPSLGSTTQKCMTLPHREPPRFHKGPGLVPPRKNARPYYT